MQLYYKNSALTISVDSATGDDEGFLHKERPGAQVLAVLPHNNNRYPQTMDEIKLTSEIAPSIAASQNYKSYPDGICFRHAFTSRADDPLSKRAWTLQEDILAPRTIHYASDQLVWECQSEYFTESTTWAEESRYFITSPKKYQFLDPIKPVEKVYRRWYNIVADYTTRDLTVLDDRLPAISGIAREIQAQISSTYKAGIWMDDLRRGLLWCYYGRGIKPEAFRAPSFSWAALDTVSHATSHSFFDDRLYHHGLGLSQLKVDDGYPAVELVECQVVPLDGDPFGRVASGYMRLRGY
jgi:hypothetical protein